MKQFKITKLLLLVFFSIVLNACRKNDFNENIHLSQNRNFFDVPANTDFTTKKVADYLQNQPIGVINNIISNGGYPIWDKAVTSSNYNFIYDKPNVENTNEIVIIPLVLTGNQNVNAFLKAQVNADTIIVNLFRGKDYKNLPNGKLSDNTFSSEKMVHNLMLLNYLVNGKKFYNLTDTLLFKTSFPNNTHLGKVRFEIKPPNTQNKVSTELISVTTSCIVITYHNCTTPAYCSNRGGCDYFDKQCGRCTGSVEICSDTYSSTGTGIYVPPSPTPGNAPSSPTGGSSGNNLSDGDGGGGLGWEPELVDNNGFYKSRIEKLKIELDRNPEFLIPCDSINLLPLDPVNGYGKMYQDVAQHFISNDILNRVDSLSNVAVTNGYAPFNIQELDSAKGSVVNCDFFPLRITSLPFKDTILGIRYTHTELLEYFRLNLTSFITPSFIFSVAFSPYNYGGINDFTKFNQPYEGSNGALVHINMTNNGSVIQSGFVRSISTTNGLPNSLSFTFSTIDSPLDDNHPVSGNRRFGIYKDPTSNDYTFYTMGVDRVSTNGFRTGDWIVDNLLFQKSGFEQADKLWTDIQSNMIKFINKNKGGALLFSKQRIVARPRWDLAGRYLMGDIDFATLKTLMGC